MAARGLFGGSMSWTDERIQQLKDLWGQGYSASEIAGKLGGVTRNAVIGKVHRLGLSGRPSPIRRSKPAVKSVAGTVRAAVAAKSSVPRPLNTQNKPAAVSSAAPLVVPPPEKIEALRQRAARLPERQCRWPEGDPRKPDFHFCKEPAYDDLPYCWQHACAAYQGFAKRSLRDIETPGSSN